jgi:hypothetical protein
MEWASESGLVCESELELGARLAYESDVLSVVLEAW